MTPRASGSERYEDLFKFIPPVDCMSLSIGSIWPEIDFAASDAKNTASAAMSAGSTQSLSESTLFRADDSHPLDNLPITWIAVKRGIDWLLIGEKDERECVVVGSAFQHVQRSSGIAESGVHAGERVGGYIPVLHRLFHLPRLHTRC